MAHIFIPKSSTLCRYYLEPRTVYAYDPKPFKHPPFRVVAPVRKMPSELPLLASLFYTTMHSCYLKPWDT